MVIVVVGRKENLNGFLVADGGNILYWWGCLVNVTVTVDV